MKRLFIDMDGTLARFHDEVMYIERMYEEGFFNKLKPFDNMVLGIKEFIRMHPDVDVYIISSAIDSLFCEKEKNLWLDRNMPEIGEEKRLFPAIGISKADYIAQKTEIPVSKEDYLLDDYNKGLFEFQAAGGKAIKCHNNINHKGLGKHGGQKGKLWADSIVHTDDLPIMIASELSAHMDLHFDFKPILEAYDLSGDDFEYTLLKKNIAGKDIYAWVKKDDPEMWHKKFKFTNPLDAIRHKGRITPNWRDFYPKEIASAVKPLNKMEKYSLNEFIESWVNFKVDDSKLQNQMIDVDILVDTGDANYDFTPNIFANSRYSNLLGIETIQDFPSCSSLVWLCEQQGISKKELLDYLHGNSTCFDLKDKLLQTTLDESQSTRKAMNVLTFCIKMPFLDAIEINRIINYEKKENDFIRPEKRKGKSYITISKDCTAGLYSPWESSGGDFSISLIEDVKLPIKYIYSANVGDTVGTPIKNIYMDIEYKESLVAINKVHDKALDDIIYDAKVILSANDKRYESKDEIIEGRSEL